jgi:hypothetical protein
LPRALLTRHLSPWTGLPKSTDVLALQLPTLLGLILTRRPRALWRAGLAGITPQFPCLRLTQTMGILCSGKPEPWLLLELHDVFVVPETLKTANSGVNSDPPFLLVFSTGLSP